MRRLKSFSTGPSAEQSDKTMQLGLAAWGFRETPLSEQLATANKLGMRLLELTIGNSKFDVVPLDIDQGRLATIRQTFVDHGISLECMAASNDFTLPEKNANLQQLEELKQVIDVATKLGGRYLRIFTGFTAIEKITGSRRQLMIDCLKDVVDYAEKAGIMPVAETHGGVETLPNGVRHFHSTSSVPESLDQILDEVPGLYVNFDPANLYAVGIKRPEEIYRMFKDRIKYVHLKDFVAVAGDCICPASCGESPMDWAALLTAMNDFTGPVLIEYEKPEDVADGSEKSLKFLYKTILELKHLSPVNFFFVLNNGGNMNQQPVQSSQSGISRIFSEENNFLSYYH